MGKLEEKAKFFDLDYVPDNLLIRTDKASEMLQGDYPKLVFGQKDTGKTCTAKWLEKRGLATHVSCNVSMRKSLQPHIGKLAFCGPAALDTFFKNNPTEPVIFDEVHRLGPNHKIELDESLHTLVDSYGSKKFILVTNLPPNMFFNRLRADVADRYLGCPTIIFEPYDRDQILQIFEQRFKLADVPYEQGALNYLAAKYVTGTAIRDIFRVLRTVILAGREVTIDAIENLLSAGVIHDFTREFASLRVQDVMVLGAVAVAQEHHARRRMSFGIEPVAILSEVAAQYNNIAKLVPHSTSLSHTTVYRALRELEEAGYVSMEAGPAPGGRGRTTYVKCAPHYSVILKAFGRWFQERFGESPFYTGID